MSVRGWAPKLKQKGVVKIDQQNERDKLTKLLDGSLELLVFFNILVSHDLPGPALGSYNHRLNKSEQKSERAAYLLLRVGYPIHSGQRASHELLELRYPS